MRELNKGVNVSLRKLDIFNYEIVFEVEETSEKISSVLIVGDKQTIKDLLTAKSENQKWSCMGIIGDDDTNVCELEVSGEALEKVFMEIVTDGESLVSVELYAKEENDNATLIYAHEDDIVVEHSRTKELEDKNVEVEITLFKISNIQESLEAFKEYLDYIISEDDKYKDLDDEITYNMELSEELTVHCIASRITKGFFMIAGDIDVENPDFIMTAGVEEFSVFISKLQYYADWYFKAYMEEVSTKYYIIDKSGSVLTDNDNKPISFKEEDEAEEYKASLENSDKYFVVQTEDIEEE